MHRINTKISVCAAWLLVLLAILTGCGENSATSAVEDTSSAAEDTSLSKYDIGQNIKQQITDGLTSETLQYISGDLSVILTQSTDETASASEDCVNVSARVILPQSIPVVAEELCPCAISIIEEAGYSPKFSINYYEESNAEGADGDSLVHWQTNDGQTGVFVVAKDNIIAQYSLDELYEYYDNFGKEDTESEISEPNDELDKFGNLLDDFQGEWITTSESITQWRVTIEDDKADFFWLDDSGEAKDLSTYYFDISDDGELFIDRGSKAPQQVALDENGNMQLTVGSMVKTYKRINAEEPAPEEEPVSEEAEPAPEQSAIESSTDSSVNTSADESYNNQGGTVYVTKTGKKYHYDSHCNGGTYTESTLSAAQARGLTPCAKCAGG